MSMIFQSDTIMTRRVKTINFYQTTLERLPFILSISRLNTPLRFDEIASAEYKIGLAFDCQTRNHAATPVGEWAPRGGAAKWVRPEIWSSPKWGTLVRSPLTDRLNPLQYRINF